MDVNDDSYCLDEHGVRAFFASRLAPTGIALWLWLWPLPLPLLLLLLLLLLWLLILIYLPLSQRPNAGVAQGAPRQGCRGSRPRPWMAFGDGPPEQCRSEGMPSLSEAPNGGAKPFAYFSLGRHSGVWKSESL